MLKVNKVWDEQAKRILMVQENSFGQGTSSLDLCTRWRPTPPFLQIEFRLNTVSADKIPAALIITPFLMATALIYEDLYLR